MTRLTQIKRLRRLIADAPKENRGKMAAVLQRYEEGTVNNFRTVQNAMIALSHPSMFGPREVVELYQKTLGVQNIVYFVLGVWMFQWALTSSSRESRTS